jgi:hypothetical protein
VNVWIAGFLISGLTAQGVARRSFAESTSWGFNGGWQREILIFNLFAAAVLIVIRRRAPGGEHALVWPLTILSLLLGLNHFSAAVASPDAIGNWQGAIANGLALVYGISVLVFLNHGENRHRADFKQS